MLSYRSRDWSPRLLDTKSVLRLCVVSLMLLLGISFGVLTAVSPKADASQQCSKIHVVSDASYDEQLVSTMLSSQGYLQVEFPTPDSITEGESEHTGCFLVNIRDDALEEQVVTNVSQNAATQTFVALRGQDNIQNSANVQVFKVPYTSGEERSLVNAFLQSQTRIVTPIQEEGGGGTSDSYMGSGNTDDVSPAAFANRVKNTASITEALRYLTASRWEEIPVPSSQMMEIDNQSSFTGPLESATSQTGLTFATSVGSGLMLLAALAFSSVLADVFISLADRIVATFAGLPLGGVGAGNPVSIDVSNPSYGNTAAIVSAFFLIALFATGWKAFSDKSAKTLNKRLTEWAAAMARFVAALVFAMFVAIQSRSNWEGGDNIFAQTANIVRNNVDLPGVNESTGQAVDMSDPTAAGGGTGRSIGHPGTWTPGSFGWFISVVYWFANLFTGAAVSLTTALLKTPFDLFTTNVHNATQSGYGNSTCDRYVDSLHYAFSQTAAAQGNSASQLVLLSIDTVYKDIFYNGYAIVYGGNTASAHNSWCWALEQKNSDISPGEWALHSRNAGLYKEALGVGNLFDGSNRVTSGDGMYPPSSNLVSGAPQRSGLLINERGGWKVKEDNGGEVIRLSRYMGRESTLGANQARYYFAACEWPIQDGYARLSFDWQGVRGMGETGGSSDESEKVKREAFKIEDLSAGSITDMLGSWQGSPKWNDSSEIDGGEINFYLEDVDCQSPTVVPIGYGEEGESKFGFGTESVVAERWEFTPLKDTLISSTATNVRDSVVASSGLGGAIIKGLEQAKSAIFGGGTSDDNAANNPEIKFGANMKENGTRPAYEFWKRTNGSAGGDNSRVMSGINFTILMLSLFIAVFLIPAFMINTVVSIMFIALPAIAMFSFIAYIMRGARGRS